MKHYKTILSIFPTFNQGDCPGYNDLQARPIFTAGNERIVAPYAGLACTHAGP